MSESELSRPIRRKPLPGGVIEIEADERERAAMARRFGVSAIETLQARVELSEKGKAVLAEGHLSAEIVQPCAVSGEDFQHRISEDIALRFVPLQEPTEEPDMEIELDSEDLDEIEYEGDSFDLGEAIAQSLGLAIDPYAEGPDADAARAEAGIKSDDEPSGPLAEALRDLKLS